MKNSRVVIVDDEESIRKGLSDWLSQEHEVITFESAESFLEAINDFEFEDGLPTCILLDFQMSGMNGVELQSTLKLMNIDCPVIFMSGNALQADIIEAWQGGAVNFILKPFTGAQVSTAITKVFEQSNQLQSSKPLPKTKDEIVDLPISQREAEILMALGSGLRQNEVAEKFNISLRTVKMHRASLKNKLGLNTIVELIRYCDEYRLSIENSLAKK